MQWWSRTSHDEHVAFLRRKDAGSLTTGRPSVGSSAGCSLVSFPKQEPKYRVLQSTLGCDSAQDSTYRNGFNPCMKVLEKDPCKPKVTTQNPWIRVRRKNPANAAGGEYLRIGLTGIRAFLKTSRTLTLRQSFDIKSRSAPCSVQDARAGCTQGSSRLGAGRGGRPAIKLTRARPGSHLAPVPLTD